MLPGNLTGDLTTAEEQLGLSKGGSGGQLFSVIGYTLGAANDDHNFTYNAWGGIGFSYTPDWADANSCGIVSDHGGGTEYGKTSGGYLGGSPFGNYSAKSLSEANGEGFALGNDGTQGALFPTPGASQKIPGCLSAGGLTSSSIGGNGEGPYFLGSTNGGSFYNTGPYTKLYCYNSSNSVSIDLGGAASSVGGSVSGRSISDHLVIPLGDSIWRNGRKITLTSLCGGLTNWIGLSAWSITPTNAFMVGSAYNNTDTQSHAVMFVPADMVPDYYRTGAIDNHDRRKITSSNPYRFWINDTSESGDIASGDNDIPGSGINNLGPTLMPIVHGKEDLINYFPLYLDLQQLIQALPPGQYTYSLSQADSAVDVVFTDLKPSQAGGFLTNNAAGELLDNTTTLASASRVYLTPSGTTIPTAWLSSIGDTNTAGGVILVNGLASTTNPLVLSVLNGSQPVASIQFPLSIDKISNMYRLLNLRGVTGGSISLPTSTNNPSNYPDARRNGKMFVFVHGFNVSEAQSTAWFAETFKRLYQSGANSMFTGVVWNGNANGFDYWQNVDNAFLTSQALTQAVNRLPGGATVIMAHSLGNMVVSSAINDWGLNVSQYFMLDAAVPMEAFDPSTFGNTNMVNPSWTGYNQQLWASYWYSLFPVSDARSNLTWNNRFGNLTTQITPVNFYSSGEDVLANGPATVSSAAWAIAISGLTYTPDVWYIQEQIKGTDFGSSVMQEPSQGGWGFNHYWDLIDTSSSMPAQNANALTTDQLKTNTFFTPFTDSNLTGTNGNAEAARYTVRAQVLGAAIPALSLAVGANAFDPIINTNNFDMMTLEDGWPSVRLASRTDLNNWYHSDAKNVAYPFTHLLWQQIVNQGLLK